MFRSQLFSSLFLFVLLLICSLSFCLSPSLHFSEWILPVSGFSPLSFLLPPFSSSYGPITPLPSIHISLSLPFHLSSFISCSAQLTWRQSCVFGASLPLSVRLLTLSGTSPSAPSTVPLGHGSLFPLLKFVLRNESDKLRATNL